MMIRAMVLCVMLLVVPVSSWAAITYVGVTNSEADTLGTTAISTSVVVSAGTDPALVVCVQARGSAAGAAVSSITRGAQSFTLAKAQVQALNPDPTYRAELWVLPNATVGTANVVVNWPNTSNDQGQAYSVVQANGVSLTSPIDSSSGAGSDNGTVIASTITTVADGALIIDCTMARENGGVTVGAGQTVRVDRIIAGVLMDGAGVSTVDKVTRGAEVMDWTQAVQDDGVWVHAAISLTPSGGSDPNPVVAGQVTLTWTNNTDPGVPSSGIASTTIRRGTGANCDGTTAPAITTVPFPLTTFVDKTVQVNTSYCYSAFHTDNVGLVSSNHATVRVTTSGTPPTTPPSIAGVAYDNTGVTITPGAVTPTRVKVWTFTNLKGVTSFTPTWASLTAGRYNQTWYDGLEGSCVSAIDAAGIENTASNDYRCVNLINLGLVEALDITPPTLTCPTPINLPHGTTSWAFSCDVNKPNTAAMFETSDTTYALMTNQMLLNSMTFSGTVTGLTNNSTTTRYVRGATLHPFEFDANGNPLNYPNTTSYAVVINVAAAPGDVTPPGDVASLVGSLSGNSATLSWGTATDAVSYQVHQSTDNVIFAPAGNPVAATNTQFSLNFNTTYYWKIKAYDAANNISTNFSNTLTLTTPAAPDVERPSRMTGLRVVPFVLSVVLDWSPGTDNSGLVFGNIEYCPVVPGQMDCVNFSSLVGQLSQTFHTPLNLIGGVRYCFRGNYSDLTGNVSLLYSETVCATNPTTGLSGPRQTVPFGVERDGATRPAGGTRIPRP